MCEELYICAIEAREFFAELKKVNSTITPEHLLHRKWIDENYMVVKDKDGISHFRNKRAFSRKSG